MKAKVPLYRTNPTRAVLIDTEATHGAVVGVNLFNQDGSLYVPPSADAAAPDTGIALDDVQVLGPQSVTVTGSMAEGAVTVALADDATTPGNTYLYSTGLTGAKGWNALSGMLHPSANVAVTFAADGTATFDLQPLTDSGAGTFKLITRDTYGRLAGIKDGTTSDVPEGSNLYFTAARVLATVLAGLSTATNAVITAADSVLVALGKLQAQITANVAAIAGKLAKSANLSDVANAATAVANLHAGFSRISVSLTIDQTALGQGSFATTKFNNVAVDSQSEYSPTTGGVTVKQAGVYLVSAQVHREGLLSACDIATSVFVNGAEVKRLSEQTLGSKPATGGGVGVGGACVLALNSNDVVTCQSFANSVYAPNDKADGIPRLNYMDIWRLL